MFHRKQIESIQSDIQSIETTLSLEASDPEFIKLANESGLTPQQFRVIQQLKLDNDWARISYLRKFHLPKRKVVFAIIFSIALCIIFSIIFSNVGYRSGYFDGVQDTKRKYSNAPETSVQVYVSRSGTRYHEKGCSFLSKGGIPISLYAAKSKGYTPCSKCNPPD